MRIGGSRPDRWTWLTSWWTDCRIATSSGLSPSNSSGESIGSHELPSHFLNYRVIAGGFPPPTSTHQSPASISPRFGSCQPKACRLPLSGSAVITSRHQQGGRTDEWAAAEAGRAALRPQGGGCSSGGGGNGRDHDAARGKPSRLRVHSGQPIWQGSDDQRGWLPGGRGGQSVLPRSGDQRPPVRDVSSAESEHDCHAG